MGLFQKLLLCVRHWAKQRGIYGQCHDFGYMGGMAWSLCCAWVCQIRQRLEVAKSRVEQPGTHLLKLFW